MIWCMLLKICNSLAIVPIRSTGIYTTLHRIYSFGFLTYSFLSLFYNIYGKFTDTGYIEYSRVLVLLEITFYTFLSSTVIATVASTAFVKSEKLKRVFERLKNIDRQLNKHHKPPQLWSIFILLHTTTVPTMACDVTVLLNFVGTNVYQYQLQKVFLWYHVTITNILLSTLAHDIRLKFARLNESLEDRWKNLTEKYKGIRYCRIQPHNRIKVSTYFEEYRNFYDRLSDVVDDCNQIFGVTFLLFVLANISNIVYYSFAFIYFNLWQFWMVGFLWIAVSMVSRFSCISLNR